MTGPVQLKGHSALQPDAEEIPVMYFRIPKWKLGQYGATVEDKIKFSDNEDEQVREANADGTQEYVIFRCEPVSETYFTPTQARKIKRP